LKRHDIADRGRRELRIEADAILGLITRLDDLAQSAGFVRAVEILRDCRCRVALTGMGKSGSIALKIASTLASTGTPAFFLHPAEGGHGDLGMLAQRDMVVAPMAGTTAALAMAITIRGALGATNQRKRSCQEAPRKGRTASGWRRR
jgi:arabinose-5-phosphate isomerase